MFLSRTLATALALPLLLSACVDEPLPTSISAAEEISRLQAQGYRVTARSESGGTVVLRYAGAINGTVQCGLRNDRMRTLAPQVRSSSGSVQEFKLNTHLVLTPGSDGIISAGERDGLYVVSKITRPAPRARATEIETIAFAPGARGTFPSGLSCKAS